jgi:polyphosphate kinase
VRREGDGVRHYLHVGTGNYNAKTARLYTDFGLLTCDEQLGNDVADMFNFLTGFARPRGYRKVLVAPAHMRQGIIAEIDKTIAAHSDGRPGRIRLKMNSLVDKECIRALYRASQAGVQVEINVRGICCLKPGVPGVSENIRVISVVGRFLEHSRIYWFRNDGADNVWLSSADWMDRNFFRRIELCFPILEKRLKQRIIKEGLKPYLEDNCQAWVLNGEGDYRRQKATRGRRYSAQEELLALLS